MQKMNRANIRFAISFHDFVVKSYGLQLILLLALLGGVAAWAETTTNLPLATVSGAHGVTRSTKTYIVTLRAEADQDGCVNAHQIKRGRSFRHALNGFVADLDDAAVARLQHDPRVLAVEQNGPIRPAARIYGLPTTETIPSGLVRMGITNFQVWRDYYSGDIVDVDVAVLDTGIDTGSGLLNVVQSVGFADPGYYGG
jgi:hypothetical protein